MRFIKNHPILKIVYNMGIIYPAPSNISYLWNFGSLALTCLIVQIITGIFLAMHYVANVELAFLSVEHIMRDVNYGWLIRYIHANGASMFFLVVYIHIFRGLYYGSYLYPRDHVWGIGVIILFSMIGTAFMGYVLPWGQMSFWAATVITNLASAIPFIGTEIVYWLWGGFSVDNATLNRFFSFHYILPFVIIGLVIVHLLLLHEAKSNNPLGIKNTVVDKVPFTPYFTIKDIFGVVIFFILFIFFIYFKPNVLGHPDNYIPANPLSTPAHIVPEWYFLPFYAILRSVPDKLGGVTLMTLAILILILIPYLNIQYLINFPIRYRSKQFSIISKIFFYLFFIICLILGWIGGNSAETPYVEIGQICTFYYFLYFLYFNPLIIFLEDLYLIKIVE